VHRVVGPLRVAKAQLGHAHAARGETGQRLQVAGAAGRGGIADGHARVGAGIVHGQLHALDVDGEFQRPPAQRLGGAPDALAHQAAQRGAALGDLVHQPDRRLAVAPGGPVLD